MSKIQQIQPKYEVRNIATGKANYAARQSFGRNLNLEDLPKQAQKILVDGTDTDLDKKSGIVGWCLRKLGLGKGEIQSQMLNAVFTSTLAPYVIYNNPFTDKSKEDKEYLAWRQPLSAVIALAGGLPMTLAINNYLNKIYDEGYNKVIDLRWNPSKGYIKKQFKQEKGIKKPFFLLSKDEKAQFTKFEKAFKRHRKNAFARLLSEDPGKDNANFVIDEKTKTISIVKNGKQHKIGKNIPNIGTREQLNNFLNENNFYNRSVGDIMQKEFHFEFHDDGELKGQLKNGVAKEAMSKSKALDFAKEIGLISEDRVDDSKLRESISKSRQRKHSPSLADILYGDIETTARETAKNDSLVQKANKIFNAIGRDTTRNVQMIIGEEAGKETSTSLGQFLHQIGYKLEPTKEGDKPLQSFMDKKVKDALDELKGIFVTEDLEGFKHEANIDDFAKNMLERMGKRNSSFAGTQKTKFGMILNIGVVMITCSILNWVYPRFMEKFRPNLVQSHKKGGAE